MELIDSKRLTTLPVYKSKRVEHLTFDTTIDTSTVHLIGVFIKFKTVPVSQAAELLPLFPHTSLLQVEAGEAHINPHGMPERNI